MTSAEVLRGLAAWRLVGCRAPLPSRPLSAADWDDLLTAVDAARMRGLLAAAVASGDLPATPEQTEIAETAHRQAMTGVLDRELLALSAEHDLAAAGIEVRLLKGLATAHLDELEPSLRCFYDVDLLVPRDRLPDAVNALERAGFRRDLPERRPGFDRRFAKEATMSGADAVEVDLHRTLVPGVFGLSIVLDELWDGSSPVVLADRTLLALDADRRLLNACYAAVLGDPEPRLVQLRDTALLLNSGATDLDRALGLARSWRGEAVVAAALRIAAELFEAEGWPLLDWARRFSPTFWSRRALSAYESQGGSNTRVLLSGALAPLGALDRAAYLRALLLPARDYVTARHRAGRPSEWRTGLRELLRGRRN